MMLADMLGLKRWHPAETADLRKRPETEQSRGLRNPQPSAEICGEKGGILEIRRNPQPPAESETRIDTGFPGKSANPQFPQPSVQLMEKPLPLTREYFDNLGLKVLADDVAFLSWHLPRATAARNQALREYVHRWREATDAEPAQHRKDNAGRRAANTWLCSEGGRYK